RHPHARRAGGRRPARRRVAAAGPLGRGRRRRLQALPAGARRDRLSTLLCRPDRRRLGGEARPQLRRLHRPDGAGRGLHDGRQGRRRAHRAVEGRTPGRGRPAADVRRPGRSVPAGQVRAAADLIGYQPYYVGPIGAGSVAKLVHNCAGYIVQTALAEVFTMGVKAGVEPIALWKAVRQGAGGRRRTFDGLADQFLPAKFEPPSFALRLAHKDVTLATALGREHKVPMRLANITLEEMTEALNRGWAERDSRVAMLLQEERAGVQIKVTEEAIREALAIDKTPPR